MNSRPAAPTEPDAAGKASEELARFRRDNEVLRARVTAVERDKQVLEETHRALSESFVESENRNSQLASLYVASYRLLSSLNRDDVLTAIQEIVANLIGSEELAIFESDPGGDALSLATAQNVECMPRVALGSGAIGRVASTGQAYFAEGNAGADGISERHLTACIPLKRGGTVIGVIAVFRLLPQKSGLEPIDRELFDLLGVQAAMALYCAAEHTRAGEHFASRA